MGPLPPVLQASLSCRTKFVFRRLRHMGAEHSTGMTKVLMPQFSTKRQTGPFLSPVERVTASGQSVVIECGDGVSRVDDGTAVVELFALDSKATEEDAMVEAFGEFAITKDDLIGRTRSSLKRGRVEEDEDLPCYFLAPRRRSCSVGGHNSADADSVLASPSRWGAVETDADGAMWRLLQEYDELLCVEAIGDATEDLYCYPDHRKDDEFDSNAEDFSGNDYPDDADERSGESAERAEEEASGFSTERRGGRVASHSTYGMFCEEGYSERSLSSVWNSDG
ncbi:conserved hypothetical protein [Leishmania major strain Friedlin]|uniref:Transcription factor Iwr1 domain-containing protein n=1 Tax=Leishmania major TaxID=5664 RepID=Q4Q4K8_LEIMA|nr:conserved hypothetical protein [Leishmania major strain Friedlin]CAG9580566.1 Protein_of_unknown_function_(DUF1762)_-_putative [Leishmania major strain Friedlin]CAJ05863.1 conserved hypothetical protein [Leishmania major strain Friedlin]|eukprot:XP_001685740.1 conserved hypothetical protein [Leishmania major strain Friedlin]